MRARILAAAIAATVLFCGQAQSASPKDWTDCRGKDADKSVAACNRVLNDKKLSARERADALQNRGLAWKAKSDNDRALADFNEAIRADRKWAVPYAKRGDLYDDLGDQDRAIVDLNEAIRIDPDYEWAYAIRGYILDQRGEHDRAIADYTQSIRLDPKDVGTITNRGWTKRKKGDLDGAFADFNEALRINPTHVRALFNRGSIPRTTLPTTTARSRASTRVILRARPTISSNRTTSSRNPSRCCVCSSRAAARVRLPTWSSTGRSQC